MEKQQIDPIPGLIDKQPTLPPSEAEAIAKFEQEIIEPPDQGFFQIGFRMLVLEARKLRHLRVFDRAVRRIAKPWLIGGAFRSFSMPNGRAMSFLPELGQFAHTETIFKQRVFLPA
jgi:hypothetical protein